jgi:alkylhydroperoxidase family enzyme
VASVMDDLELSPLSAKEKALFRFIEKVNDDSPNIGPADMEVLCAAGWEQEAIYDAITVCALFNFFNRWIDSTGVHAMSDEAHRIGGQRTAKNGYVRSATP